MTQSTSAEHNAHILYPLLKFLLPMLMIVPLFTNKTCLPCSGAAGYRAPASYKPMRQPSHYLWLDVNGLNGKQS